MCAYGLHCVTVTMLMYYRSHLAHISHLQDGRDFLNLDNFQQIGDVRLALPWRAGPVVSSNGETGCMGGHASSSAAGAAALGFAGKGGGKGGQTNEEKPKKEKEFLVCFSYSALRTSRLSSMLCCMIPEL